MEIIDFWSHDTSLLLLFILSFLAATVLPIGSEWLVVAMVVEGFSTKNVVATATCGNYLGACTTYMVGIWGSTFITDKVLRIKEPQLARAEKLYERYGSWSLLLSWLPIAGDPLCILAGTFKTGFLRFSILVFSGKFIRYATLAYLTSRGMKHLGVN